MNKFKHLVSTRHSLVAALAVAGLISTPAHAVNWGVDAGLGTLGLGAAVTMGVTPQFSTRLGFGRYSYDESTTESDIDFDGEVQAGGNYLFADWHPWSSSFRVSGGVVNNLNGANALANTDSNTDIGDGNYSPSEIGNLTADVSFETLVPYLGIGWGNSGSGVRGWGVSFDLGVMFQGDAAVDLSANGTALQDPIFQDNLALEEERIQSDINDSGATQYYPLLSLSVAYRF